MRKTGMRREEVRDPGTGVSMTTGSFVNYTFVFMSVVIDARCVSLARPMDWLFSYFPLEKFDTSCLFTARPPEAMTKFLLPPIEIKPRCRCSGFDIIRGDINPPLGGLSIWRGKGKTEFGL